jgi:hypothetical protein
MPTPYAIDNAGDTAFHWIVYKGSVSICSLPLHLHCNHGNTSSTAGDEGDMDKQDVDMESNNSVNGNLNCSFHGSSCNLYEYLDL